MKLCNKGGLLVTLLLFVASLQGALSPGLIELDVYISGQDTVFFSDLAHPTVMDDEGHPYLDILDFYSNILEFKVAKGCTDAQSICDLESRPPGSSLIINPTDHTIQYILNKKKQSIVFSSTDLVFDNGSWWISAALFTKLNPETNWNPLQSILKTTLPLSPASIAAKKRAASAQAALNAQMLAQKKALEQAAEPVISSGFAPSGQIYYSLNENYTQPLDSSGGQPNSNLNGNFNLLGSLFKGTISASGSQNIYSNPSSAGGGGLLNGDFTWNYAFNNLPNINTLQFGYVQSINSPFFPQQSLTNGILVQKLPESNQSVLTFTYQGQTQPDTEIQVWRNNSYLVSSFTVDSSGKYTITDNQATPGDVYAITYYYPDGTSETRSITYASGNIGVLAKSQSNYALSTGELQPLSGYGQLGNLTQWLYQYGLFNNFTVGYGGFYFPVNDLSTINPYDTVYSFFNYFDFRWQLSPGLAAEYSQMLDSLSNYYFNIISTWIPSNTIQMTYTHLTPNSSLLQIPIYTPTGQSSTLQTNNFNLSDSWSVFPKLGISTSFQSTPGLQSISTGTNYRAFWFLNPGYQFMRTVSGTASNNIAGTTATNNGDSVSSTQTFLNSVVYGNSYLQYSYTIQTMSGNDTEDTTNLNYSYRPQNGLWNTNLQWEQIIGQPTYTLTVGLGWNPNPNWALSLNYSIQSISLQLTFNDALKLIGATVNTVKDFGSGEISGRLMSPSVNGAPATPLSGVVVTAGTASATSNEDGYFSIIGVPANTPVKFSIDLSTLDPSLMPTTNNINMQLTPGAELEYNPEITVATGMDGYIQSNDPLPEKIGIQIQKIDSQPIGPIINGTIFANQNYFSFQSLIPGTYNITFTGLQKPEGPFRIIVPNNTSWVSNVIINFDKNTVGQLKE